MKYEFMGLKIRYWRLARDLSLQKLAFLTETATGIKMTYQRLARVETGKSQSKLYAEEAGAIAWILQIPLDELYSDNGLSEDKIKNLVTGRIRKYPFDRGEICFS